MAAATHGAEPLASIAVSICDLNGHEIAVRVFVRLDRDPKVGIISIPSILGIMVGLAGCALVSRPTPKQSGSITVAVSPASASLPVSQSLQLFALVHNDSRNNGVSWSLSQLGTSCSPRCGSIAGFTSESAVYAAPPGVPSPAVVTISATSIADNTRSATATITIASITPPPSGGAKEWADITKYGARSLEYAPTASMNCFAGSNIVTLSNSNGFGDFTQFENGDSIRLDGCGPTSTLTAPSDTIVAPGMNGGGSYAVESASPGSTPYNYQVIACDQRGGCSPASSVASTTNGFATLGRVTANISTFSLSNNIVTVTTKAPHGFIAGAAIWIVPFTTSNPLYEGQFKVASVPNSMTFTFISQLDSRVPGTVTSATGGTAAGFNCNVIAFTTVSGAWKYYLYSDRSGRWKPIQQQMATNTGPGMWLVDYGSPMMDNQTFNSWVPKTPPVSATNDYLVTMISSGGGTNSIVVATAPTNSNSGGTAQIGSDVSIANAAAAAKYGTLYIPGGIYWTAAFLDLSGDPPLRVLQAGTLRLTDTLRFPGTSQWNGYGVNNTTAFSWTGMPLVEGENGAYPVIATRDVGSISFDHIQIGSNSGNGNLLFYADGTLNPPTNYSFSYVNWSVGTGSLNNYMGQMGIFGGGGFSYTFDHNAFVGPQAPNGNLGDISYTFLPAWSFTNQKQSPYTCTAGYAFRNSWFVGRSGIEQNVSTNQGASAGCIPEQFFEFNQTQNLDTPLYSTTGVPGNSQAQVTFRDTFEADYPTPMVANLAAWGDGQGNITVTTEGLFGAGITGGHSPATGGPVNQTVTNVASSGPVGGGWFAAGGSLVGYLMAPPNTAPTLAANAGGGVPVGSHTYQTSWIDAFGNSTTVGPSATIKTSTGMQTVTVTPPAAPAGAVGWQYYRDGARQGPASGICGPFNIGTSQTDTLPFPACANSVPSQNIALSSGQGKDGEETTQIELTGGGHKSVIRGAFTADRLLNVPDVSGTIAVTIAKGTVAMPTDAIAAGSCGVLVKAMAVAVDSTDVISLSDNAEPAIDSVNLRLRKWPTPDNVNFQYCNGTQVNITPLAATLNWQVVR
jgi:hypothetical protein